MVPLVVFLLLPFLFITSMSDPLSLQSLSAYEVLKSYNFPIGILPKGALGYDLDSTTGKFSAYFNGTCTFSIESYQIRYQSTISGTISTNHLGHLHGVSVKVLLFWINIAEVVRGDDELEFSVGIASADFPIDNFNVCPECGCGMNCNGVGRVKLRSSV